MWSESLEVRRGALDSTPRSASGRGASSNPRNRFEPIGREPDPEAESPAPGTEFIPDRSKSIIATNDSPDVGFGASINPYRGCEHGCIYCLAADTLVLYADMTWRPIADVRPGDLLMGFDEYPQPGETRKLRKATVEAVRFSRRRTMRVITDRTQVFATPDHRWLQSWDFRWSRTDRLSPGKVLRYVPFVEQEKLDDDYRIGYLAGISLGDGTFRYQHGWRSDKCGYPAAYWRVALVDQAPLDRIVEYLGRFGVAAHIRPFFRGHASRKPMQKVEVRSLPRLAIIDQLIHAERPSRSYYRGFLAGFFDAEGSNGRVFRISQVDLSVLDRVESYARILGLTLRLERRESKACTLRLVGTLLERIRFFSTCQPAIQRKIDGMFGREMNLEPERVRAIEAGPLGDVVDIQTSTRTFCAAGLATHNCYARPTHEYLGFSSGLDFETKILFKESAPELLRRALASPRWVPQVLAISGVTDPFQPVERRLELTRKCLAVLAEFRNPVVIITKNFLVTRDVDHLAELARHNAAAVLLSITTLRPDLCGRMEPRTSRPKKRLEAIRILSEAGIPAGVNVAPVIPGLTDEEIPAIIEAARDAGARFAGMTPLRLPFAVKGLFEAWLEKHLPDRKEKILNRIRAIRGGRLNDPNFGSRMKGEGIFAEQIAGLFALGCKKAGISGHAPALSTEHFRRPGAVQVQMDLF
jgi:DNA repair photolyase